MTIQQKSMIETMDATIKKARRDLDGLDFT